MNQRRTMGKYRKIKILTALLFLLKGYGNIFGQELSSVLIKSDTLQFNSTEDIISFKKHNYAWFVPGQGGVSELIMKFSKPVENLTLSGKDFVVIDSLSKSDGNQYKARIRFGNIAATFTYTINIKYHLRNGEDKTESFALMPLSPVSINADPATVIDLFLGEEKTLELEAVNPLTIEASGNWVKSPDFDYTYEVDDNTFNLSIRPYSTGSKTVAIQIDLKKPFLDKNNKPVVEMKPLQIKFYVKPTRINFLNADRSDFYFDDKTSGNQYIQFDFNKTLELNKLYRIEDQLEQGGKLIAEIYTRSMIGENRVICSIHPYSLHKTSEGYLYLKTGDQARFVTNFNILLKPSIDRMSVLREGEEWNENLVVRPGESVDIKIEGKGLSRAKMFFDGCEEVKQDSSKIFDDIIFYSLKVPLGIDKKRLSVFLNKKLTRYDLVVKEFQKPKNFDYVAVNYGTESIPLLSTLYNQPILYSKTIRDINIMFNPDQIENEGKIYGKQYLVLEVKLFNENNDLIEFQRIDNFVVCPGSASPRHAFYRSEDCNRQASININDYLLHKTYEMDSWWKIEVVVKNDENKYQENGYSRKIILIKQAFRSLDLQVSFPAGLFVRNFSEQGIGQFSGVSAAFLAQLSFYDRDRVYKLKPYKIGVGFIAINALNLNSNRSADIGAIVMGSVVPLKPNKRFNFPLYLGFGYLLKASSWFAVFGPGVQFNF